ncbi:5,10-methylenetetrahydrofolate reductase [Spongisporangium articulatum]|uniref:5,10-methylenetetrahydrofolate reductase n=1 Tax=Spongisporangium articulatum TaxID=3362603 RepID=A0ABW8AQH5_9ACTN
MADRGSLLELLGERRSGALLVGLTPPRRSTAPEKVAEIADRTMARLRPLDLDGVVLYDIDDESDRIDTERPFPYLPTLDPAVFRDRYFSALPHPSVVYRCVGKYDERELEEWLAKADVERTATVFVGASSGDKQVRTTLARAHELRRAVAPGLLTGSVVITERYKRRGDEHVRMLAKQRQGCDFFVSQVVYDTDATKSLLSEYHYLCREAGEAPRPVVFTLSVCGSLTTLDFLKWLGVDVPRWFENTLRFEPDPLERSFAQSLTGARELRDFCGQLGLPYGFNVESVSSRRIEIEAAMRLAGCVRELLDGGRPVADAE